jgi:hypothetical protein
VLIKRVMTGFGIMRLRKGDVGGEVKEVVGEAMCEGEKVAHD